jgi:hypothetical protein
MNKVLSRLIDEADAKDRGLKIMSRDDFAMAALTGLLAGPTMIKGGFDGMADMAYRIADAMLVERERLPYVERQKAEGRMLLRYSVTLKEEGTVLP